MNRKLFGLFTVLFLFSAGLYAQSDDDLFSGSDEDFFASIDDSVFAENDDDLFGGSEDDLFDSNGIEVVEEVNAKTDLSKGVLFENGSIKIGGNLSTSLSTMTTLYSEDEENFGENLKNTKITPTLSSFLTVDARPTQYLRMYTKFGISYPTSSSVAGFNSGNSWFKLKELFTDFSIADAAFFRFGIHTVSWGTGYFFSPVSDIINTSSINPEDATAQVDGSLNLRTQITFPNTQNCLWFYVIPSTDFTNSTTAESYIRDTALAGKFDLVLGGWEFGLGGFWKYENAPKGMITFTGSLKKLSVYGEFVYSYGAKSEWAESKDWANKTNIFQFSVGVSRMWKNPSVVLAAQYYFDGNGVDKLLDQSYTVGDRTVEFVVPSLTKGHNIALMANFDGILFSKDLSATFFAMANFGKDKMSDESKENFEALGQPVSDVTMILSAMLNYTPFSVFSVGVGPYLTWETYDNKPTVSLKISAKLGGGKF